METVSIPPRKVSRKIADADAEVRRLQFPFHQGRFQGSAQLGEDTFRGSFHSTKEGFKAPLAPRHRPFRPRFPFHQGRFQGGRREEDALRDAVFPFHQGRFQGRAGIPSAGDVVVVSIPPRKVSRTNGRNVCRGDTRVSIPPRKVSR